MACVIFCPVAGAMMALPVAFQLQNVFNLPLVPEIAVLLIIGICAVSPAIPALPVFRGCRRAKYQKFLYFPFILLFFMFCFLIATDIAVFAGYLLNIPYLADIFGTNVLQNVWLGSGVAALTCTFYSVYEASRIPSVRQITLASEKIKKPTDFVLLSDLHLCRSTSPQRLSKIVSRVNALLPQAVFIAGDTIDDDTSFLKDTLNELKKLDAAQGVYFVSGNHEFYHGYTQTVQALSRLGFTLLDHQGVHLENNVFAAGVPDIIFYPKTTNRKPDVVQSLNKSTEENYKILLSHTPQRFAEYDVDLILSGHTHGGQIFPFHIFVKLHHRYLAGLYHPESSKYIYVSRGTGQWGPPMRFLAPAEITLLHLRPQ